MQLYIIIHVSFSIEFTLHFGSKTVVQSANVKTTEVIPADVKEVSHDTFHS